MEPVEARYVTRASRNLVRHIRHKLERQYGAGLVGLIHPVTKEFNHEAVIQQRGGRHAHEVISDTRSVGLHHVMSAIHTVTIGDEDPERPNKWMDLEGRIFDRYDLVSYLYGWIIALQENPQGDTAGASNCFMATFELVQQTDYFISDLNAIRESGNYFDALVYQPTHMNGNFAATYE